MEVEEVPEVPTKCVTEIRDLWVRCGLHYIDFEGLADGRSVKEILSMVSPQKMVAIFFLFCSGCFFCRS